MKQFKYALSLAALFFIAAIIPGLICVLCRFNVVFGSSGIALATVLLLKGQIAKKIFGSNNHHSSSPRFAIFLIVISIFSGIIHFLNFKASKMTMEKIGYYNEMSRGEMFSQLMLPLIFASLFWAVVVGIVTYVRGRSKANQFPDEEKKFEDSVTVDVSNDDISAVNMENKIESNQIDYNVEADVECNVDNALIQSNYNQNIYKKETKEKSIIRLKSQTKSKKGLIIICCSIIVIILYGVIPTREHSTKYQIGEYLYVDDYNNIHSDMNCDLCLDDSPQRILYKDFVPTDTKSYCRKCIPDDLYKKILVDCEQNIRISRAYSLVCEKFSSQVYSVMFDSNESFCNYIKKGDLWALHMLYAMNAIRIDYKGFESFEDFLLYFDRGDLIGSIPHLYTNMKIEDKKRYLALYNRLVDYYTGYQYKIETDDDFISNAQQYPKRRAWVYEVCKNHMNIGTYDDFEKTILF